MPPATQPAVPKQAAEQLDRATRSDRSAPSAPRRHRWMPAGTWDRQRVVAALRDWATDAGEPPRTYEWSPATARALGLSSAGARRWEQAHPRWPSTATVFEYFGTWSEALETAGLPARSRPLELPLNERVAAAQRMSALGHSTRVIAEQLGVSADTA